MRKWFTALALVAAMFGGAVGVGAHDQEGTCPLSNLPDCCEKAQSASNSPEVSMARLCCNLNCSEPGSSGTSTSSNVSPQQGTLPITAIMPGAAPFNGITVSGRYAQTFSPHDSNPKYIQHLALLI
jgi:hypothetical protein